jgi:hypothetical protein
VRQRSRMTPEGLVIGGVTRCGGRLGETYALRVARTADAPPPSVVFHNKHGEAASTRVDADGGCLTRRQSYFPPVRGARRRPVAVGDRHLRASVVHELRRELVFCRVIDCAARECACQSNGTNASKTPSHVVQSCPTAANLDCASVQESPLTGTPHRVGDPSPARTWPDARRRYAKTSGLSIPAIAVIGGIFGYAVGGWDVAFGLAIALSFGSAVALGVVYVVGRRQWSWRESMF